MTMSDPLADMLTRIRNGQMARLSRVSCPASKLKYNVLEVLKNEGYIRDFEKVELDNNKANINIDLKYHDGEPVIKELTRISKPGRRVYTPAGDIPVVHNGLGVAILSTSHGVVSDYDARQRHIGGEVLCRVF